MSELQILYQTYLPRTNLRRRKSQKPNTSKNVLATSPSRNIIFSFLLFFLYQKRNGKTCLMMIFVAKRVLFPMMYWKLNLVLVFVPKYSFFWETLYTLVVSSTWTFSSNKKSFLNCFFLLSFYDLTYFEQKKHRGFSSCMVVRGCGWCPSKPIVLAKDSLLQKFQSSNFFWLEGQERI